MSFLSSCGDGFAFVACRVSPRRASSFLLLRQKKRTKEKATPVSASPALCTGATCAARTTRAARKLALRAQTCALLDPRCAALLGAYTGEGERASARFASRVGDGASLTTSTEAAFATAPAAAVLPRTVTPGTPPLSGSPMPLRWCAAPAAAPAPHRPCVRAEERSGGRIKQGACLSAASLRTARLLRAPQAARSAAQGHAHQGRLLFAYFLLAKQEKVSRPPGRNPACPVNKHLTKHTTC